MIYAREWPRRRKDAELGWQRPRREIALKAETQPLLDLADTDPSCPSTRSLNRDAVPIRVGEKGEQCMAQLVRKFGKSVLGLALDPGGDPPAAAPAPALHAAFGLAAFTGQIGSLSPRLDADASYA